jgi:hypothetical protein
VTESRRSANRRCSAGCRGGHSSFLRPFSVVVPSPGRFNHGGLFRPGRHVLKFPQPLFHLLDELVQSSDHWSTRGSSCSAFKVASWGSQPEMFSTQIAHPGAPMCRSRTLIARARKQRCQFNRSPGPRSVLVNSCTARGCRFFTRCPPDRAANTRTDKQKPPRRPGEQ